MKKQIRVRLGSSLVGFDDPQDLAAFRQFLLGWLMRQFGDVAEVTVSLEWPKEMEIVAHAFDRYDQPMASPSLAYDVEVAIEAALAAWKGER